MSAQARRERFDAMDADVSAAPAPPGGPVLPCEMNWVDIELYDENGRPMADQPYEIRRASGGPLRPGVLVIRGRLDKNGYARETGIEGAQECIIDLPGLENPEDVEPMPDDFWAELSTP